MTLPTFRVRVLQGPNLNLVGSREPDIYGSETLADIEQRLLALGEALGVELGTYQSNHEGALIDEIQASKGAWDGLILNLGAYTHTSIAIRDALAAVDIPFVEVHLSNLHARETFRQRSMVADLAVGVVMGFGPESYLLGLRGLVGQLRWRRASE